MAEEEGSASTEGTGGEGGEEGRRNSKTFLPGAVLSRDVLTSLARRLLLVESPLGKAGTAECPPLAPHPFTLSLKITSG